MPVGTEMPAVMVLFASDQLWPNIHSVAHWKRIWPNLNDILIYVTLDEQRSLRPAQRLEAFFKAVYPGVRVRLSAQLGMRPQDVREQLGAWRREFPDHQWVLNATGGTKLMTPGILDQIGQSSTTVVYRELQVGWFAFERSPAGSGFIAKEISVPPEETDTLPIGRLVEAVWQVPPGAKIECAQADPLDLLKLTQAVIGTTDWNWADAFVAIGRPIKESSGFLFERYICAGLLELGVGNVARNFKVTGPVAQELQEVDIVVNSGGRLVVLDCKLTSPEEEKLKNAGTINDQIRAAGHTRTRLGGLGAEFVMIRPNRTFSEDERALAEELRVRFVDVPEAPRLFSILADLLRLPSLAGRPAQVEAMLAGLSPRKAFARESPRIAALTQVDEGNGLARLDKYMTDRKQNWVAYFVDGVVHVHSTAPAAISPPAHEAALRSFLGNYGTGIQLKFSASGCRCTVVFAPHKGALPKLSKALEAWLGRDLTP